MKLLSVAVGTLCLLGVAIAQEGSSSAVRQPARLGVTPPVDAKEADLVEREKAAAIGANDASLRALVSEHFDYLSQLGDSRLESLRKQIAALESELKARKEMKDVIVESEVLRLKLESRSISFRPVQAALLRSTAAPKRQLPPE